MRNFLAYFYHINVQDIIQFNDKYRFIYDNKQYILDVISDYDMTTITNIYNLSMEIIKNGIICNKIILNMNNEPTTYYENKTWILMQTVKNFNKKITFQDVFSFPIKSNAIEIMKNNDWKALWSRKLDYLEYQINQFGLNYPVLRESFAYFNGLSENAIQLFDLVNNEDLYIVHKRIKYNMTYYDFYNPFNMVFDTKIRDMAEYFKDAFILKNDITKELMYFLDNYHLDNNEKVLFIIRMLYPTFYFDTFQEIINNELEETKIKKIILNIDNYEQLLKKIINYIGLVNIEWLKKSSS